MLVYQCADAQDYVLTTRGDSLTGEVKPLLYGQEKRVQLISSEDDSKKTFSIFQVREFTSEGEVYHPIKGESGYVFMKLLQPGYLSLYAYQMENQTRFDGLFMKKLDGANMSVPNLGFKKYVSRFLEDCPAVVERIETGELGKKNLPELVDAYNACVDSRTVNHSSVIAQKELQTTKMSAWDSLEMKVRDMDFSEKTNALEMIAEIRKKIERQESIPNFLVEGLRSSLKDTGLTGELDQAIQQIK
jgi:hypothetical protein